MITPKDTDQFLVDLEYGHHYHVRGCIVTNRFPNKYRELSYGEIRALQTSNGELFEPDICITQDLIALSGRAVRGTNLSDDTYQLVKSIAKWVASNSERESIFLTPEPSTTVNAHDLLDHISAVSGVSKDKIGEWVNG